MTTRARRRDDSAEVKSLLQARVKSVVAALIPGALDRKWATSRMTQPPFPPGRRAGSFTIWLDAERAGAWKDFASAGRGDIIQLVNFVHGRPRNDAFAWKWARDFLGLGRMDEGQRRAAAEAAQAAAARREREAESRRAGRARRAATLFYESARLQEGALAWIYLTGRQCCPGDVPHLDRSSFRYRPSLEWWKGAVFEGERKVQAGPRFPALIAALRDERGQLRAVHCTFVARDGIGKAPVDRPKLVFGEVEGAVVRVSQGPTGLTPEEHAAAGAPPGVLVICEGIEDALTLAIDLPEARVWAAFSLGNLMHVPVWHPCVERVIVAADNDWAAPQAADQLERALDHLRLADKPVSVMRAPAPFKDFNDWKRGIA